ncbi:MAG: YIP1 family protein [Candidatus Margulisbacteria bacterium]|nr:YIP1 family protein [Candidatus Margulisiibacteriota bacterium]
MKQRIYQLLTEPEKSWRLIKSESTTPIQLLKGYAAPLALVPIISSAIKLLLVRGHSFNWSFLFDLAMTGLANYVLLLAALLFSGWIVSLLAPYFGSKGDLLAAHKTVVYSVTPVWLASIFQLVPRLSGLSLLGFYGAFLLYTALPVMLETPADRQTGFAAAIIMFALGVMMFLSIGGAGALYL